MILSQQSLHHRCKFQDMITPYVDHQVRGDRIISYGLSSFGYDVRCVNQFKIFNPPTWVHGNPYQPEDCIDPTNFDPELVFDVDTQGSPLFLPGHGYALTCTLETFKMPRDLFALVIGKSTLARCGLLINATPLEPGWEGQITLELANLTHRAILVHPNMGIAQVVFFQGDAIPDRVYDDTRKYQKQVGIVLPR